MVLQQEPYSAQIWGFCNAGSDIIVQLFDDVTSQMVQRKQTVTDADSIWLVRLDPMPASNTSFTVTANCSVTISATELISLTDILFGDVFVCSGQSNMVFTVDQAFNASQNTAEANDFPLIRVFTAGHNLLSKEVQTELPAVLQPWSVASNKSIGSGAWTAFSAVCWFTAIELYKEVQRPLGLISSDHSGSPIRCWMPAESAAQCNENITEATHHELELTKYGPAECWNAMMEPLLRTTIKSVLWYQGEEDTKAQPFASEYACAFPLMVREWRARFSAQSGTDALFPFGYVQLSVFLDSTENVTCGNNESVSCLGAALVRWGQGGNATHFEPRELRNVFFASAIDLGDPSTPYTAPLGPVHPRYKKPVGQRLAAAALNVVYGDDSAYFGGPFAESAVFNATTAVVTVSFSNVEAQGIWVKNNVGFEVFAADIGWVDAMQSIKENGASAVDVAVPSRLHFYTRIRYNFYTAPCLPFQGIKNCALYDRKNELPAVPFVLNVTM